MASDSNTVNVLTLPEINNLTPGDFLSVFTVNGTKIIDISNLNFQEKTDSGGANFTDTLSAIDIYSSGTINTISLSTNELFVNGVDYSDINTTLNTLSSDLTSTISQVSSTILSITPNVYVAYAIASFPNNTRYAGIGQFYTNPSQFTSYPIPSDIKTTDLYSSDFNVAYLSNTYSLSSRIVVTGALVASNQSLSALVDLGSTNTSGSTLSAEVRIIKYY